MRFVHGVFGVLLCAAHVLLFLASVFKSETFCEVYIWFMIVFWVFLILSAVVTATATMIADKILFGTIYLLVVFLCLLLSVYFTIIVANYRMTLP